MSEIYICVMSLVAAAGGFYAGYWRGRLVETRISGAEVERLIDNVDTWKARYRVMDSH